MAKTIFYNPKIAAFGIDVSIVSNAIQFEIAKAINPQASGRPQPGSKVYDWDAKAFFSLTADECAVIDSNLNQILDGTYNDPKASDPKYAHVLTLTHFRDNKPSRYSVQRAQDAQGNPINSVTVSISPAGGQSFFYPLRVEEMLIWRWFIKSGYQRLPYDSAILGANGAIEKEKRKIEYDKKNSPGQGQSQGGNQGGYQQNNSAPPGPTFDDGDPGPTPPPEQTPPPQQDQSGGTAQDIDFDF